MEKKEKSRERKWVELLLILVVGLIILNVFSLLAIIDLQNDVHNWCEVTNLGAEGLNMLSGYLVEYDLKWEALPEVMKVDCPKEIKWGRGD